MGEYKSWYNSVMGENWKTAKAREEYRKGNIKTIVATINDIGRSRVGASRFNYWNIFVIDKEGKWHRIIGDDNLVPYYWSKKKQAWYNTAWGEDRLYSIVLAILDITVGRDEIPEIVRLVY